MGRKPKVRARRLQYPGPSRSQILRIDRYTWVVIPLLTTLHSLVLHRYLDEEMPLSVWLLARPLSWADWIILIQWVSDGKYPLCHWGVLVTPIDVTEENAFIQKLADSADTDIFGTVYELFRDASNQNSVNIKRPFTDAILRAEWPTFSAKYLGTTEMSYEQIENEGE